MLGDDVDFSLMGQTYPRFGTGPIAPSGMNVVVTPGNVSCACTGINSFGQETGAERERGEREVMMDKNEQEL